MNTTSPTTSQLATTTKVVVATTVALSFISFCQNQIADRWMRLIRAATPHELNYLAA